MMDTSNTKYRIRQCSECSDGLEYFCVPCSRDLCLQCREEHVFKMAAIGDIHNVIKYREKSKYLKNQELCLRHPNSVYDNYCDFCNIPICSDCTEHRAHKKTNVGTAYEIKRRQNKAMIQKIEEEEIFCCSLWFDIDIDFKIVSEDVKNKNSELPILSKNLKARIDSLLYNFPAEIRCLKQKIKMIRCIASTQKYEHVYEQSSIIPIKFLLSAKKTHHFKKNKKNFLKHHCKATLRVSTIMEYVIEKLPTIKLSSQEKRIQSITSDMGLTEKVKSRALTRAKKVLCVKSPQLALAYLKCYKMLFSKYPIMLQGVIELEKPLVPIGVGPVYFQQEIKFILPELLTEMKKLIENMIKRKMIVEPRHIFLPNMCVYFQESSEDTKRNNTLSDSNN